MSGEHRSHLFAIPVASLTCRTWERQYVFVAATMPEEPDGARGVSVDLRKRFPGLQWLAGRQLHQAQQKLQHTWVSVSDANWESSLVVRVSHDEYKSCSILSKASWLAERHPIEALQQECLH